MSIFGFNITNNILRAIDVRNNNWIYLNKILNYVIKTTNHNTL